MVLWFIPWLYHVPQAALAAIVITAVLNLVKPSAILKLFRISKVEASISVATLVLTIVTAPRMYWGVFAGIMLSQAYYLYHHLHPRIIEVGEHPDGSLRSRKLWQLPPLAPEVVALRMDADLDFATATALERYAADALQQAPQARDLALLMQSINSIDITGVETFARLERLVALRGGLLHVVGLKLPAEQRLERAGLLHKQGSPIRLYRTDADFLRTLGNFPTELAPINADEKPTSTKR